MMRFLERDVLEAAREHAMAEYPSESCGAVTAGGYVPLQNVDANPERAFDCDEQIAPMIADRSLLALIHSHPDGPFGPSNYDMAQQVAMDVPWGIVICTGAAALDPYFWGDCLEPPPLLGRQFRHGPSGTDNKGDCFALVRDWYRIERGIILKDVPREDMWWNNGGNLYLEHFESRGFVRADRREPEIGDVAIMQVLANVPNHAGIYVGRGMLMHHLPKRFSRIEPSAGWMPLCAEWVRHAG